MRLPLARAIAPALALLSLMAACDRGRRDTQTISEPPPLASPAPDSEEARTRVPERLGTGPAERPERPAARANGPTRTTADRAEARPAPAAPTHTAATRNAVESVQTRLIDLGFAPGYPDGQFGPNTRAAVREFQRERGLQRTGGLDAETLHALFTSSERTLAAEEIERVRGVEPVVPARENGRTVAFGLGAGVGFLLAALLAGFALFRRGRA